MPLPLMLADAETAVDAHTFASRAARVGDGSVRLRAADGILVMTCAPIAPRGLLDASPTILGMRVLSADREVSCDLVVDAAELRAEGTALRLPDTATRAAWAGVSPPVSGWMLRNDLTATSLLDAAHQGIAEVATAVPTDAGDDVVRQVRAQVWGAADDALDGLPRGVAFAAQVLGFLGDPAERIPVREAGAWVRLTLRRGHVLVRRPLAAGLTPVRPTGSPA